MECWWKEMPCEKRFREAEHDQIPRDVKHECRSCQHFDQRLNNASSCENAMPFKASALRVQLALVLGLLIGNSTFISDELLNSRYQVL